MLGMDRLGGSKPKGFQNVFKICPWITWKEETLEQGQIGKYVTYLQLFTSTSMANTIWVPEAAPNLSKSMPRAATN